MPWLFDARDAEHPWPLAVRTLAHIALTAQHDTVAEQAVEEAMRVLHHHVGWWDAPTLVATFACVHEALFAGALVPRMRAGEAIPLDAAPLARLLGRFNTYLPSLWTLLVAEYGALGADAFQRLLDSLAVLLHVPSGAAVATGITALHQVGVVLAGPGGAGLDAEGWDALARMLRAACTMDAARAVPATQRYDTVHGAQRLAAEMLHASGRCMPPSVHLEVRSARAFPRMSHATWAQYSSPAAAV